MLIGWSVKAIVLIFLSQCPEKRPFVHPTVISRLALRLPCPSWASVQLKLERHAADLVLGNNSEAVTGMLTEHSNDAAATAVSSYLALFETLVARYHDGYSMKVSCKV